MSKQYTVELPGHLDPKWNDMLYGMQVTHRLQNEFRVLCRLYDLNISITQWRNAPFTVDKPLYLRHDFGKQPSVQQFNRAEAVPGWVP